MLTIRLHDVEITGDDDATVRAIYRELAKNQPAPAVPASAVAEVTEAIEAATGLQVTQPAEQPAEPAQTERASPPRSESSPEIRDRQRAAAARAREALAEKRRAQAQAAAGAAGATASVSDLTGDREDGDKTPEPDSEPEDYAGKTNGSDSDKPVSLTVEQRRAACFAALQDAANLSDTSKNAVRAMVQKFGVAKIRDVPPDKLDDFWKATASLCTKYNVQFPPPAVH